jgi:hypothetical protein
VEYAPRVTATATFMRWRRGNRTPRGDPRWCVQFGRSCANQPLVITSDEVARLLIQKSSSTSASIAASALAGASLTADMVAQDGLAQGLRLLNPARTCAALGEARVIQIQIMPAVVLDVCNSGTAAECGE